MVSMPKEEETRTLPDDTEVLWCKHRDVHWYIIGGHHTVTACRELAEEFRDGSDAKKELLELEIIPVFFTDRNMLVQISNAINLNIAKKVAKESFQSSSELERAT